MAPEILRCDLETRRRARSEGKAGYGPEVDCWAIGVLTYECLTGKMPYEEGSTMEETFEEINAWQDVLFTEHQHALLGCGGSDTPAPHFSHVLSQDAKDFIVGCLRLDPTARLTAREMLSHPWIVNHHPTLAQQYMRGDTAYFMFDSAKDEHGANDTRVGKSQELHLDVEGPTVGSGSAAFGVAGASGASSTSVATDTAPRSSTNVRSLERFSGQQEHIAPRVAPASAPDSPTQLVDPTRGPRPPPQTIPKHIKSTLFNGRAGGSSAVATSGDGEAGVLPCEVHDPGAPRRGKTFASGLLLNTTRAVLRRFREILTLSGGGRATNDEDDGNQEDKVRDCTLEQP